MTQLALSSSPAVDSAKPLRWVQRLITSMVLETWLLMAIGSATRVMNAGLACPDWPLCYGAWIPREHILNLQVFLEWFHRLMAGSMGMCAIALLALTIWFRTHLPRWLPWASGWAVGLIGVQALLGGLTVTHLLRFDIVTAHLGTALLFFVTLVIMATQLVPHTPVGTSGKLVWLGGLTAGVVYGQSLLGALVGSQWAAHQCLSDALLCTVMNRHLWGILPTTLGILTLAIAAWRTPALHPTLRHLANGALGLLLLQCGIGVATLRLHLQVEPLTVTHQAVGALLLGGLVAFSTLAWRDRRSIAESSSDRASTHSGQLA